VRSIASTVASCPGDPREARLGSQAERSEAGEFLNVRRDGWVQRLAARFAAQPAMISATCCSRPVYIRTSRKTLDTAVFAQPCRLTM